MSDEPKSVDADLLDRLLPGVQQPTRYAGGEWNSVVKDWNAVRLHVALAYPDLYDVGMSNLGLAILYELLNDRPEMLAERVYAPWNDMERAMREAGVPLYGLESHRPLRVFDWVGFSLAYELNYSNVLNMLDLAGIPLAAADRGEDDPIVIGGGSMTYNAEPMADFFDLFVIGEGEEVTLELADLWLRTRSRGRHAFLDEATHIQGIYVPSRYEVRYAADGTVDQIRPRDGAPARIRRRIVPVLPPPPTRLVVPYVNIVHDRASIEIARGCSHGCRFCHAGMVYRPARERPLDEVLAGVDALLANTGHEEVALVSLSSSDYADIERLIQQLLARHSADQISFSLPSLRIDSFSVQLASLTQARRKTGLTFAPEAGSQRLRNVINKGVTEEDLLATVEAAFSTGWRRVKLYFMMGLPTETDEDIEAMIGLSRRVLEVGRRHARKAAEVAVSVSTFVPKPFTPFQWMPLVPEQDIRRRQDMLRANARGRGLSFSWHSPASSALEAALARGDRRIGTAILEAWRAGARFDAWNDLLNVGAWRTGFERAGLDPDFYARRERRLDETLPWEHIDVGVTPHFLQREWEKSLRAESSTSCLDRCMGCGIQSAYGEAIRSCRAVCGETAQ